MVSRSTLEVTPPSKDELFEQLLQLQQTERSGGQMKNLAIFILMFGMTLLVAQSLIVLRVPAVTGLIQGEVAPLVAAFISIACATFIFLSQERRRREVLHNDIKLLSQELMRARAWSEATSR